MHFNTQGRARVLALRLSAAIATVLAASAVQAQTLNPVITSGDLLVSSTTYVDPGFAAGTALPYSTTFSGSTANATVGSAFCSTANCSSGVWTNGLKTTAGGAGDGNFGLSSQVILSAVNASNGTVDASLNVTSAAQAAGLNVATSFASKSELALNFSPDGKSVTFMAYNTSGNGLLDISNANSYAGSETGNTDTQSPVQRGIIQFNLANNNIQQTLTGAYTGNNGRAAVLAQNGQYYTAGNAGNGNGDVSVVNGNGIQQVTPGTNNTSVSPIGAYNITQNGYTADKTSKDSNYRGLTIFNNTLYATKGSGSNGINTIYQVGATGALGAGAITTGAATPVSVLPGMSTVLAKATPTASAPVGHPFGLFFANSTTLYVADEGSGAATDFTTQPYEAGGIQKYSLVNGSWVLDYTLKGTLIGTAYTVNGSGAVCGGLSSCSLTTQTDGLRNIAGQVNSNGTVTLYAVTSTAGSLLGDAGADPNKLVAITDSLAATTSSQVAGEDFSTVQTAALGQVLRGVAVAPVPIPGAVWLFGSGLLGLVGVSRRRKANA